MEHYKLNKTLVLEFYRYAVAGGDLALADRLISDDYIQHSDRLSPGKAGLMESLKYLKHMAGTERPETSTVRMIAEGDFVAVHMDVCFAGEKKVVLDLYRLHQGQLAEHWDAIQDVPGVTCSGNSVIDGPVAIKDTDLTQQNKKIVARFYETIYRNKDTDSLSVFVHADLVQHHPEIDNGLAGLRNFLLDPAVAFSFDKIHRIISEGNFVVTQSTGKVRSCPVVLYDICQLSDRKILTQWSVWQTIPDKMVYGGSVV